VKGQHRAPSVSGNYNGKHIMDKVSSKEYWVCDYGREHMVWHSYSTVVKDGRSISTVVKEDKFCNCTEPIPTFNF